MSFPPPAHGWTCFHCDETFHTWIDARDHFGAAPNAEPACLINRDQLGLLRRLREAEQERDELRVRRLAQQMEIDEEETVARFRAQREP